MSVRMDLQIRDYPAFHAMAPHAHETPSMNIILSGGFMERIGTSERHYLRGHIAFFPAGMTHSQRFGAAATRQIIFRPEPRWLDPLIERGTRLAEAPYFRGLDFCQLGQRLVHEIFAPDVLSELACEGILLEILAAFGRSHETSREPASPPAWLVRVREFLHARPCTSLRMAEVAKTAGRHEVHVAREFRRFYGASIGEYLRRLRLDTAALRLADPRADICVVALDCGFSSHSHLCREFKRRFGLTPSQYRASRC